MNPAYQEYMASDAWKAKRLLRLDLDGHKCRTCGCTHDERPLQVHHVTYVRFGHEDLEDLITLCNSCHEAITDVMRRRRYANRNIEVEFEEVVSSFSTRVEINYGMANVTVSAEFTSGIVDALRPDGEPGQSVRQAVKASFLEEKQDRR